MIIANLRNSVTGTVRQPCKCSYGNPGAARIDNVEQFHHRIAFRDVPSGTLPSATGRTRLIVNIATTLLRFVPLLDPVGE